MMTKRLNHPYKDEPEQEEITSHFTAEISSSSLHEATTTPADLWTPSGNWLKDFLFFSGPGWFVSIAYVDPGNYQADIQAGGTSRYSLVWVLFWTSILSIYVQVLCVRLVFYGKLNLAEAQAKYSSSKNGKWERYFEWFMAEFSTVITDLPGVIGIGIAMHHFVGWPYYVGVILSLLTTMVFLMTLNYGHRILEVTIFIFVGIMSVAIFMEMVNVQPDLAEMSKGWFYGFTEVKQEDIYSIAGIIGAVVMPHNLYLHSGELQSRTKGDSAKQKIKQSPDVIDAAVKLCSIEPVLPILVTFFINLAVIAVAAETVYGMDNASQVGLTDFCLYFQNMKGGCFLWAIALLAAGQSGAITTTHTGQFVMDGFLNIQIPMALRALVTRLIAITPSVIVSILFPAYLNGLVNIVNALLGILLPFAFTPLVKYNCSEKVMGPGNASKGIEKIILYSFAVAVWAINAMTLSIQGGGFFGEIIPGMSMSIEKILLMALQIAIQIGYAWWNFKTLFANLEDMEQIPSESEEMLPIGSEQVELT
jgi:NRAMP (natural resistance-associated macrophage protein)-like metal ion transporter